MKKLSVTLIAIFVAVFVSACSPGGFVKEDLDNMKQEITTQFSQKGFQVNEVELIIESPKIVTGYAKIQKFGIELLKKCSATWGEEGRYIWRCE